MSQPLMPKKLKSTDSMKTYKTFQKEHQKKRCSFHHKRLECTSRKSRDTQNNRQVGLGVQNEPGQRLIEFCQENTLVIKTLFFNNTRENSWKTHGHHQMVNPKIRLIMFFAVKVGEALSSEEKQDLELSVAQIITSLLQNSCLS